jgi:hypothetical protein
LRESPKVPFRSIFFWPFRWFDPLRRVRREMAELPRTRLADAKHWQVVRVVGNLRLVSPPLRAPSSGRECAAFREQRRGLSKTWWWINEVQARDFIIDDGSGRALVRIGRAIVLAAANEVIAERGWRGTLVEAIIEDGATVAVVGLIRKDTNLAEATAPYRDVQATPLYFAATGDVPLLVCDDPAVIR